MSAATAEATEAPPVAADVLEVVLTFTSLDDYRAMGADLAAVRSKLGLPTWSTPVEVIAAALSEKVSSR